MDRGWSSAMFDIARAPEPQMDAAVVGALHVFSRKNTKSAITDCTFRR